MGKTASNKKKTKTKVKNPLAKNKNKSSSSLKSAIISGAPEKELENSQTRQQGKMENVPMSSEKFNKLLKKCLKANHFKQEDKAIRKAQRMVNKSKKKGSAVP